MFCAAGTLLILQFEPLQFPFEEILRITVMLLLEAVKTFSFRLAVAANLFVAARGKHRFHGNLSAASRVQE